MTVGHRSRGYMLAVQVERVRLVEGVVSVKHACQIAEGWTDAESHSRNHNLKFIPVSVSSGYMLARARRLNGTDGCVGGVGVQRGLLRDAFHTNGNAANAKGAALHTNASTENAEDAESESLQTS